MTAPATLDAAVAAFRRAWHRADGAGREGERTREGLVAALAVVEALEPAEGPPVEDVFAALEGRPSAPEVEVDWRDPEPRTLGALTGDKVPLQAGDRVEILPGAVWHDPVADPVRTSVPERWVGVSAEVIDPCDPDGDVEVRRLPPSYGIAFADPAHVRRLL